MMLCIEAPKPLLGGQYAIAQHYDLIAIAKLPAVRFAMDRAGMVGADGATHCGAFDVTFMASLPNMITMAPSNEAELINMVATCVAIDDSPSCFRFPRGNGIGVDLSAAGISKDYKGTPLEVCWGADPTDTHIQAYVLLFMAHLWIAMKAACLGSSNQGH